jgi:hypothetical protein
MAYAIHRHHGIFIMMRHAGATRYAADKANTSLPLAAACCTMQSHYLTVGHLDDQLRYGTATYAWLLGA